MGGGASDEDPVSELRSRRCRSRRLTSHHATARAAASRSAAAPAAMPATTGVGSAIGAATGASNLRAVQPTIDRSPSSERNLLCINEVKRSTNLGTSTDRYSFRIHQCSDGAPDRITLLGCCLAFSAAARRRRTPPAYDDQRKALLSSSIGGGRALTSCLSVPPVGRLFKGSEGGAPLAVKNNKKRGPQRDVRRRWPRSRYGCDVTWWTRRRNETPHGNWMDGRMYHVMHGSSTATPFFLFPFPLGSWGFFAVQCAGCVHVEL